MPTKLFVGNVSQDADSHELRKLFEKYGHVEECDIVKNFGFVHMSNETEAYEAVNNLDKALFERQEIRVEISHGKSSRGRGGPRGGFRGGRGGRGGGGDRYGMDRGYGSRPPPRGYDRRDDGYGRRDYYDRPPRYSPYDYERRPPPRDAGYYYRDRSPPRRADPYYRRSPPVAAGSKYGGYSDPYEYASRRRSPPPADRYSRSYAY